MKIKEHAEKKEIYIFAIEEKSDGKLIGTVTLRIENNHKRAELAYWFRVPF
ncbi:GNAT family N-acetyltransferase [Metabacillus idriensis]|uniref:GNAT family N-acetyltransferase n=1 Tax=Metabacillus idriensis TaxID=324768 RepID=UPI00174AFEF6|nr:hypothetical protein [Metabacillus idriensis]